MRTVVDQAQGMSTRVSPELERLENQRVDILDRLPAAREELIRTIATVNHSGLKHATAERLVERKESEVSDLQARLDATEGSIALLQGRPTPAVPQAHRMPIETMTAPPPTVMGMRPNDFFGGAATVLLLFPLVLALAQRILRGGKRREVSIDANPQITRLEQAVEAIAIEVERIGEAQRFSAKLAAGSPREPVIERVRETPKSARRVVTPLP